MAVDARGPYVTPEFNNELQCNVANMWDKFNFYLIYASKDFLCCVPQVHLNKHVVKLSEIIIQDEVSSNV